MSRIEIIAYHIGQARAMLAMRCGFAFRYHAREAVVRLFIG